MPSFLDLPVELRLSIFEMVSQDTDTFNNVVMAAMRSSCAFRDHQSLIHTSQKIRKEAMSCYCRKNTFWFNLALLQEQPSGGIVFGERLAVAWARLLDDEALSSMRHIVVWVAGYSRPPPPFADIKWPDSSWPAYLAENDLEASCSLCEFRINLINGNIRVFGAGIDKYWSWTSSHQFFQEWIRDMPSAEGREPRLTKEHFLKLVWPNGEPPQAESEDIGDEAGKAGNE